MERQLEKKIVVRELSGIRVFVATGCKYKDFGFSVMANCSSMI